MLIFKGPTARDLSTTVRKIASKENLSMQFDVVSRLGGEAQQQKFFV
jgi:putative aminopeptidase FrvX